MINGLRDHRPPILRKGQQLVLGRAPGGFASRQDDSRDHRNMLLPGVIDLCAVPQSQPA